MKSMTAALNKFEVNFKFNKVKRLGPILVDFKKGTKNLEMNDLGGEGNKASPFLESDVCIIALKVSIFGARKAKASTAVGKQSSCCLVPIRGGEALKIERGIRNC